jgi:hypothetical protein
MNSDYNLDTRLNYTRSQATSDFQFPIDQLDTIFVLTVRNAISKEKLNEVISKMVVIKNLEWVNLHNVSKILTVMKINKLNIFSIDKNLELNTVRITSINLGCEVNYTEIRPDVFIRLFNEEGNNFLDYNLNSLYILRNGNYKDIKNLFSTINNSDVNLGRWRWSEGSYFKSFGF